MSDLFASPEIDGFFSVHPDVPHEAVIGLAMIYPVYRSALLEPGTIVGVGRASRWVEWMRIGALKEAVQGRVLGQTFAHREKLAAAFESMGR